MLNFTKMHSLGNDFVVVLGNEQTVTLTQIQAESIADRYTGIGCDQILLVNPIPDQKNVFEFLIFNSDGSESAQCGNGARCVAKLLYDRNVATEPEFVLRTKVDDLQCKINEDDSVTVSLGVPQFNPDNVPFVAESEQDCYLLNVNGQDQIVYVLSIGNPHAVMLVENVDSAPVEETGDEIESHPRFPQRTNVSYMQIVSDSSIRLRVHERGVGETLACGSGACAAVIAGRRMGLLNNAVEVKIVAGELFVEWEGPGQPVFLKGPTSYVYEGRLL